MPPMVRGTSGRVGLPHTVVFLLVLSAGLSASADAHVTTTASHQQHNSLSSHPHSSSLTPSRHLQGQQSSTSSILTSVDPTHYSDSDSSLSELNPSSHEGHLSATSTLANPSSLLRSLSSFFTQAQLHYSQHTSSAHSLSAQLADVSTSGDSKASNHDAADEEDDDTISMAHVELPAAISGLRRHLSSDESASSGVEDDNVFMDESGNMVMLSDILMDVEQSDHGREEVVQVDDTMEFDLEKEEDDSNELELIRSDMDDEDEDEDEEDQEHKAEKKEGESSKGESQEVSAESPMRKILSFDEAGREEMMRPTWSTLLHQWVARIQQPCHHTATHATSSAEHRPQPQPQANALPRSFLHKEQPPTDTPTDIVSHEYPYSAHTHVRAGAHEMRDQWVHLAALLFTPLPLAQLRVAAGMKHRAVGDSAVSARVVDVGEDGKSWVQGLPPVSHTSGESRSDVIRRRALQQGNGGDNNGAGTPWWAPWGNDDGKKDDANNNQNAGGNNGNNGGNNGNNGANNGNNEGNNGNNGGNNGNNGGNNGDNGANNGDNGGNNGNNGANNGNNGANNGDNGANNGDNGANNGDNGANNGNNGANNGNNGANNGNNGANNGNNGGNAGGGNANNGNAGGGKPGDNAAGGTNGDKPAAGAGTGKGKPADGKAADTKTDTKKADDAKTDPKPGAAKDDKTKDATKGNAAAGGMVGNQGIGLRRPPPPPPLKTATNLGQTLLNRGAMPPPLFSTKPIAGPFPWALQPPPPGAPLAPTADATALPPTTDTATDTPSAVPQDDSAGTAGGSPGFVVVAPPPPYTSRFSRPPPPSTTGAGQKAAGTQKKGVFQRSYLGMSGGAFWALVICGSVALLLVVCICCCCCRKCSNREEGAVATVNKSPDSIKPLTYASPNPSSGLPDEDPVFEAQRQIHLASKSFGRAGPPAAMSHLIGIRGADQNRPDVLVKPDQATNQGLNLTNKADAELRAAVTSALMNHNRSSSQQIGSDDEKKNLFNPAHPASTAPGGRFSTYPTPGGAKVKPSASDSEGDISELYKRTVRHYNRHSQATGKPPSPAEIAAAITAAGVVEKAERRQAMRHSWGDDSMDGMDSSFEATVAAAERHRQKMNGAGGGAPGGGPRAHEEMTTEAEMEDIETSWSESVLSTALALQWTKSKQSG